MASYSGDTRNQGDDRALRLARPGGPGPEASAEGKPRAVLSRARGESRSAPASVAGLTPSGVINFRLYRPGDRLCKGKPAFRGRPHGRVQTAPISLAEYFATKPGIYRLKVGYSGDARNTPYESTCGAQSIRIGN